MNKHVTSTVAAVLMSFSIPITASATTMLQDLGQYCSNGATIKLTESKLEIAQAMSDEDLPQLARKAAREEFLCYKESTSGMVRDEAGYFYVMSMDQSFMTNAQVVNGVDYLSYLANEMAANASSQYMKDLLIKKRDQLRSEKAVSLKAINASGS